jgi:tRNA (cytidine56-2'-O)-methyltransferase
LNTIRTSVYRGNVENVKTNGKQCESARRIMVLRWGHRPQRDARLTTHVVLTARALGASGLILSDVKDERIRETIEKVTKDWGGPFLFEMQTPWREAVEKWKANGGIVVHLTAYGESIQTSDVLQRIKASERDVLVVVGSQKVPKGFFSESVSDFNVAIGNQPHSECASLAVFLDRFFEGEELVRRFQGAKMKIVPQKRGKKMFEE